MINLVNFNKRFLVEMKKELDNLSHNIAIDLCKKKTIQQGVTWEWMVKGTEGEGG
jgi:hypothetical protein